LLAGLIDILNLQRIQVLADFFPVLHGVGDQALGGVVGGDGVDFVVDVDDEVANRYAFGSSANRRYVFPPTIPSSNMRWKPARPRGARDLSILLSTSEFVSIVHSMIF